MPKRWLPPQIDGDMAPDRWPLVPVLGLIVLAWAILGWPWLSGRVTIPWDAKAHFLPQIQFMAQSFWRGESPAWAPYVFSGHAQIADPQAMLFSPPFLALAAVSPNPTPHAVDVTTLLAVLAGMIAVALWFRDRRWHWAGAVLAALAFGFGASMAWRIQHIGQVVSLALLPIVLLLLERALLRSSWRYGLAAGIVAAFLVLGRDQVALLSVYLLVAYVVAHWLGIDGADHARGTQTFLARVRRSLPPLLTGGIAGIAIIALPILMTTLSAEESNRPAIDLVGAGRGSLHPALFLTLFAPDVFGSSGRMEDYWGPPSFTWPDTGLYIAQNMGQLYIGAVPVLLLLLGLATGVLVRREIRIFLFALAAVTTYALGWYTPVFQFAHAWLPGIDFYRRPADATFLIGYLTALLAGYVAHHMFSEPLWRPSAWGLAVTGAVTGAAFAAAAGLALWLDRVEQGTLPFLVALAIVVGAAAMLAIARHMEPLRPAAAALLLVGFTVADLAYSNGPGGATALPPEHYEVLEPETKNATIALLKKKTAETDDKSRRDRVELIGLGFHWPNASLTHGLENTLGYNPVRSAHYSQATGAGNTAGSPGDRQFTPLFPSYRSPLANLLGLRFIAAGAPIESIDKTLASGDLPLIARTENAWIYENPEALPRALYVVQAKQADFAALLANGGLAEDFRQVVLLEAQPATPRTEAIPPTAAGPPGTVRIVSYANAAVVVEADGATGGYLVLNDLWHPWWEATIDGAPTEILRANVLFRAVRLPPGRHVVRFSFHPLRGAFRQLAARLGGGTRGPANP